jgi:inorganic phosphate transporter, PiT family
MSAILLFLATVFLSYWNGANDNFKGVATLYGSETVSYRTAIIIATVATFAGSVCALFFARELVTHFSGKGLVPTAISGGAAFLIAVGFGAAATVLLATVFGFPISTTHSLVGGLAGAGLMAVGADVNVHKLGSVFLFPLVASPVIALVMGAVVYRVFAGMREYLGLSKESCICVGEQREFVPVSSLSPSQSGALAMSTVAESISGADVALMVADESACVDLYTDRVWGLSLQRLLDIAHGLSAATVSFARGLNDTPKIAGLLVAAHLLDIRWGMVAIATAMAVGGLLHARKVAETISHNITPLNHGQGFSANLVTGILVIFASKWGVPVSTTHVSVGAIFGIGLATGERDNSVIVGILLSWFVTLPVAMVMSAGVYWMVS